jgi:hypothetical protein
MACVALSTKPSSKTRAPPLCTLALRNQAGPTRSTSVTSVVRVSPGSTMRRKRAISSRVSTGTPSSRLNPARASETNRAPLCRQCSQISTPGVTGCPG